MIMRTPHLTTGYDPTLTAQIAKTRPGMAHWSASGPFGRTCGDCGYLGYQQQIQNACPSEPSMSALRAAGRHRSELMRRERI